VGRVRHAVARGGRHKELTDRGGLALQPAPTIASASEPSHSQPETQAEEPAQERRVHRRVVVYRLVVIGSLAHQAALSLPAAVQVSTSIRITEDLVGSRDLLHQQPGLGSWIDVRMILPREPSEGGLDDLRLGSRIDLKEFVEISVHPYVHRGRPLAPSPRGSTGLLTLAILLL
jgi:hypothetical protein